MPRAFVLLVAACSSLREVALTAATGGDPFCTRTEAARLGGAVEG